MPSDHIHNLGDQNPQFEKSQLPAREAPRLAAQGEEQLSGASLDRDLERSFANLAIATGDISTERVEAATYLRTRRDEPAVAYRLAEQMMTAADSQTRELARFALIGTRDRQGSDLLHSEHLIRELCEDRGRFGVGPSNPEKLIAALEQFREHPLVEARLLETLLNGSTRAEHAATFLQRTTDPRTQATLKDVMQSVIDKDQSVKFGVTLDRSALIQALKYSPDPEVQALIIRAFKTSSDPLGRRDFKSCAASALGAIKTDEARAVIVKSVLDPRVDWGVRLGIVEAIKEQKDDALHSTLRPLIEGSVAKTAWVIASEQYENPLRQAAHWARLMIYQRDKIHNIRIQVGLALQDVEPDLARRAFEGALRGGKDSTRHKCEFFASRHAMHALKVLGVAT